MIYGTHCRCNGRISDACNFDQDQADLLNVLKYENISMCQKGTPWLKSDTSPFDTITMLSLKKRASVVVSKPHIKR